MLRRKAPALPTNFRVDDWTVYTPVSPACPPAAAAKSLRAALWNTRLQSPRPSERRWSSGDPGQRLSPREAASPAYALMSGVSGRHWREWLVGACGLSGKAERSGVLGNLACGSDEPPHQQDCGRVNNRVSKTRWPFIKCQVGCRTTDDGEVRDGRG